MELCGNSICTQGWRFLSCTIFILFFLCALFGLHIKRNSLFYLNLTHVTTLSYLLLFVVTFKYLKCLYLFLNKMKIKWRCDLCGSLTISDSKEEHKLDYCKCKKSACDLEEGYCRWLWKGDFKQIKIIRGLKK